MTCNNSIYYVTQLYESPNNDTKSLHKNFIRTVYVIRLSLLPLLTLNTKTVMNLL